jgi:uncharacterized protein YcbX
VVRSLWRYPLKSAAGETVERLRFTADGPELDRGWACVTADGIVVSAKQPRRWGRLLQVRATVDDRDASGPVVLLHVPGCAPVRAGECLADETLSDWLGAPVRVTSSVPPQPWLHRLWPTQPGLRPAWVQDADAGVEDTAAIDGARPGGRFVDFGAVHVVTTGELQALGRAMGVDPLGRPQDVNVRRFRPNLVLDLDRELAPGEVVQVGPHVSLRILIPTPRCGVPAVAQEEFPAAPAVLRVLGRSRRELPGYGRASCLGSYAEVVTAGQVRVGDEVVVG